MAQYAAEVAVLAAVIAGALWLYGEIIRVKLRPRGVFLARRVVARFRLGGGGLAIACLVVGLLYRSHVFSLTLAAILYAPLAVLFLLGLRWLQPHLRDGEGDSGHE